MTLDEIRTRLHSIWATGVEAGDYEAAHAEEDRLHQDVLAAITRGDIKLKHVRAAASMALRSTQIPFKRVRA